MKKTLSMITLAVLTVGLLGSCSKINERIDNLEKKVDGLENEKIASIENQITGINSSISDLNAIRSNIQSLTDGAKSQGQDITDLQAADKALGRRIEELSKYVGDTLKAYATEEWVKATFSTLEQYKATCDTIAKIDARIGALDENLSKKIADCADSLTTWINGQFEGYYTAAEMDAKLALMKSAVDSAKAAGEITDAKADSLAVELAKVQPAIDSAKAQLTREYTAAIDTAITALDGKLTKQIQDEIGKVNETVTAISERVGKLEFQVNDLLGRVSALESRVQSVTIVPAYSDGSVKIQNDTLSIDFIVSPASATKTLDSRQFAIVVNYALTKAPEMDTIRFGRKSKTTINKAIGSVSITADISDFLCKPDVVSLTLAVNVANGISNCTSDFVNVVNCVTPAAVEEARTDLYYQMARLIGSKQPGKKYNPYRVLFNMCGDDVIATNADPSDPIVQLNNFSYTADNVIIKECYTNFYKAIDVCNKFINKYSNAGEYTIKQNMVFPEENKNTLKQYVDEARVLRAWLHFTLATGWHNPPKVTEYPAPKNPTNCSYDEILKWCAEEIINSAQNCPENENNPCIVSKCFSFALAAKVYLFMGWCGSFDRNLCFDKVCEYCKKALELNEYLEQGLEEYEKLFHAEGNRSKEKIFELDMETFTDPAKVAEPVPGMEIGLWSWPVGKFITDPYGKRSSSLDGNGGCGITSYLADAIDWKNDIRVVRKLDDLIWEKRDYADESINDMNSAARKASELCGIKAAGLYGQNNIVSLKQIVKQTDLNGFRNKTNFTLMRVPELYLMLAEAESGKESFTLDSETTAGIEYLNKVRERAGLAKIARASIGETLRYERLMELRMECCTWPDIVRWNHPKAIERLKKAGKDVPVLYDSKKRPKQDGDKGYVEIDDRFYIVTTNYATEAGYEVGYKDKHRYLPYPAEAIRKGLIQNPGW